MFDLEKEEKSFLQKIENCKIIIKEQCREKERLTFEFAKQCLNAKKFEQAFYILKNFGVGIDFMKLFFIRNVNSDDNAIFNKQIKKVIEKETLTNWHGYYEALESLLFT